MIRLIFASLLAAIALFAWGGAYWAANPLVKQIVHPIPGEDKIAAALQAALPSPGLYAMPAMEPAETQAARLARGPVAMIHWHPDPAPTMTVTMVRGFLTGWLACAILLFILRETASGLPRFGQRWLLASAIGLLIAVESDLGGVIWWSHATDWALLDGVYQTVGFSLAGAILAAFTRPTPSAA